MAKILVNKFTYKTYLENGSGDPVVEIYADGVFVKSTTYVKINFTQETALAYEKSVTEAFGVLGPGNIDSYNLAPLPPLPIVTEINNTNVATPTPQQIEQTRQKEAATRQQAQENTQLQQVDPTIVEQSTPEELKPKGKAKLGQRILNLGKKILKTILPKLKSMLQQYAIAQFEIAKAEATSPEQIDTLKQQYCPTPEALADLILTRDNIVNQLNSIGNQLGVLDFSIGSIQDVTNSLSQLTTIVDAVKIGVSAASKAIPFGLPGAIPAILSDLETLDDKLIPFLEKNQGSLNATPVPFAIVISTINKVVRTLGQLDILINFCAPNSQVVPISNTIRTFSEIQTRSDINSGSYKGFVLKIEEVPYTATVTRRKAVALNTSGIKLLETPLSFTTNNQTLLDELKFIIDRDNLKAN